MHTVAFPLLSRQHLHHGKPGHPMVDSDGSDGTEPTASGHIALTENSRRVTGIINLDTQFSPVYGGRHQLF